MTELIYKNEEESVLGTVSNIRYYHQAAAWNSPLSFGVQALIEYNGLILNDRYQSDLIRVTKIIGLDDAEVRDNREQRGGESGEFPYEALYGGRNLVISGYIEAGNLSALGTLVSNLKAAFASLEESQLKFRWFDIYDSFDEPNTILEYNQNANLAALPSGNYNSLIGSLSNLKAENGLLSWKVASKVYFIRTSSKRTYCDVQVTLKCIMGEEDKSSIGFIICAKNSENYLLAQYEENSGLPELSIISVINNEEFVLKREEIFSKFWPVRGQAFWIRSRKEGNKISCEFLSKNPYIYNQNLYDYVNNGTFYRIEYNLSGEHAQLYGDKILSQVGIAGNQTNTTWSFDEFKIESLYPGDIEFQVRKISPVSIPDEQTSLTKFKRNFQIAMKTSDFRAFSSAKVTNFIEPSSTNSISERGFSLPLTLPLKFNVLTSKELPLQSNLLSINNRGNTYVEPIIYLYGPGENILIESLTNGQSLEWLGSIASGDFMIFECGKEKTVTNSLGSNYLEFLIPTTEWIRLEPKWNDIYISGSGFVEGTTKMAVELRYGYM